MITAAAGLAVVLAGCSLAPAGGAPSPRGAAAAIGSAGPVVGVNLYAQHGYTQAQAEADGARTLAYIKDDLHAGAVDIVWDMFVPGYHSDSVTVDGNTLTPADVGILTRIAQADGLLVEYRPMLFLNAPGDGWEGRVRPADPGRWFDSYYRANLPYLEAAQKYRVNEYVIGTEMNRLQADPGWAGLLARSAKVFTGEISYAANDNVYFPPDTQLPPTRLAGVDMYEKLRLLPTASLAEVTAAYESFFAQVPEALLKRTAIQETGIQARSGAYGDPPSLGRAGTLDEDVQASWFTAGCEAVRRFRLRGIFFWKVDLSDYPVTHPASSLSTFEGREGAEAISECAGIIDGSIAPGAAR